MHVADAVRKNNRKLAILTVTSNVVFLLVAKDKACIFVGCIFQQDRAAEFWVVFGTRSNFCYTAVHEVVTMMNHRTCASLPIFHALTECDSVSSFADE